MLFRNVAFPRITQPNNPREWVLLNGYFCDNPVHPPSYQFRDGNILVFSHHAQRRILVGTQIHLHRSFA